MPHPPAIRRRTACAALLAASVSALLSGCGELTGPRALTISEAELARRIGERFPAERRFFDLLDVRLEAPVLRLLPEANRIAAGLTVSAADRLFGRSARGSIDFDGALRWDDADASVRLADVRVAQLRFDRVPPGLQAGVDRLGGVLAAQLLDGLMLHRFKPEQLERARRLGLRPGAIDVTVDGVVIRLVRAGP